MTVSVVLLFGSDVDAGHVSTLPSERSRLQSILDDSAEEVEVNLVSFGLTRRPAGVRTHINLKGHAPGPIDAVLRAIGAFTLRKTLSKFPIGRLLNSMGPVDPGRVFWRAVRRNNNALNIIRRADIAIAADLPAAKTAWISLRKHFIAEAYYDHRSASFGVTDTPPTGS
ncbi:MAG: hypothetical protein ABIW81_08665 [Terrimesophilobacter sp.]